MALLILGCVLHLASVVLRGISVDRWPLGNMYEYMSARCLAAVACWLAVLRRTPAMRPLGVFAGHGSAP